MSGQAEGALLLIDAVDHINLVVSDLERSVHFYTELLGFKEIRRTRLEGHWIESIIGLKNVSATVVYIVAPAGEPRLELLCYESPSGEVLPAHSLANTIGLRHIALRVKNREPVGLLERVSVRQQRVYCWMHVISGEGEKITVRWVSNGQQIAEAHLPVGSNSWRTWSYITLSPNMIGPAQANIFNEGGELLKSLPFEITA